MKKILRFLFYFFLIQILIGCNNERKKPTDQIVTKSELIKFDFKEGSMFSDLSDSVWYVKMENSKDFFIGSIDKMTIVNDLIYILDRKSNALFIYSLDGHYINRISNPGRGPHEHGTISDYYIDKHDNTITISDLSHKLLVFDSNCVFIKEFKPGFMIRNFSKYNDKYLFSRTNFSFEKELKFSFVECDSNMKIIQKLYPFDNIMDWHAFNFFINQDKVYYVKDLNQSIYSFENDTLREIYKINFGSANMSDNYFKNEEISIKSFGNKFPYPHTLSNILENQNLLYFNFNYGDFVYSCYYSKTSKKIKYGFRDSKENPFLAPVWQHAFINNNVFVSFFEADNFLRLYNYYQTRKQDIRYSEYYKNLKMLAEGITPTDNPILVFSKIKPF